MTHEARIQERLRQLSREATDYDHGEDSQGDATALLAGADALLGVEEAKAALEVARRDAERWRWAKEHPGIAVNIFYVEWREQRDFDSAIDTEMQQEAIESTTCDMSPKTASGTLEAPDA